MIRAEIEGNNIKIQELADERGWKTAQNVAAGLAGFVVPVIRFGMNWKGTRTPMHCRRLSNISRHLQPSDALMDTGPCRRVLYRHRLMRHRPQAAKWKGRCEG
jgi:hypothetical protein